jgi:hypothetical protein
VEHRQVDAAVDDLADAHRGLARGAGYELLGQGLRGGHGGSPHSGRAPENLTTLAQRVISLCTKRLNSSGLLPTGM